MSSIQDLSPEDNFPIYKIDKPKDHDYWVCYNFCDWCDKEITKEQQDEGDMVIRTFLNGFGDRVFLSRHKKCYIQQETMFDKIDGMCYNCTRENK